MSTTRMTYAVAALREQITAKRDKKIAAAEAAYEEKMKVGERRDAWRAEQERSIRALARKVKNLSDAEIESFHIPPCPRIDTRYGASPESDRNQAINQARQAYEWAIGRLEGLAKSGSDTVTVTSKMMRDWFGL